MPYNSEVTKLQGEIAQLEEEIEAIRQAMYLFEGNDKITMAYHRTLARLTELKEHKEMKLSIHRQRTKESGVKY